MELSIGTKKEFKLKERIGESFKRNGINLSYSIIIALFIVYMCTRFNKYFFFFDDSQNQFLPYLKQSGELWLKGEIPFLSTKTLLGQNYILEIDRAVFLPQNILLSVLAVKIKSFNSIGRINAFINITLLSFFTYKVGEALNLNKSFKTLLSFLFCINPIFLYIYSLSWWTLASGQAWFVGILASILFLRKSFKVKYVIFHVVCVLNLYLNTFPNYIIAYFFLILVFIVELLIQKKYKHMIYFCIISFALMLISINIFSEFIISTNLMARKSVIGNFGNFLRPNFNQIIMTFNPVYFSFMHTFGGYSLTYLSLGYSSIYILFLICFNKNIYKLFSDRNIKFIFSLIVLFLILIQTPANMLLLRYSFRFFPFFSEMLIIFSIYGISKSKLEYSTMRLKIFISIVFLSSLLAIFTLENNHNHIIEENIVFVVFTLLYIYKVKKSKKIKFIPSMIYSIAMFFLILFSHATFLPFPSVQEIINTQNNFSKNGYILSLTNGREKKESIEDLHSAHFIYYGLKSINGYSPLGHKKLQKVLDIYSAHTWFNQENTVNNLSNRYKEVCYFDLMNITSIPIWKLQLSKNIEEKLESCGYIPKNVINPEVIYFVKDKPIIGSISYTPKNIQVHKIIIEKNNKEVYRISSQESGDIILSKPYYRGYTAKLNGKKITISDEIGLIKLNNIPNNIKDGILEISYFPRSWNVTLWFALIGIIIIVVSLFCIKKFDLEIDN